MTTHSCHTEPTGWLQPTEKSDNDWRPPSGNHDNNDSPYLHQKSPLQLPPVIKNMAFQRYSNMEQSMFTRFVRLGVPVIQLDAQGRARPSLCSLYQWRYKTLGNLPHVTQWPEYQTANPGFRYDFQLLNVEDFNGVGESEPTPYFYQVCAHMNRTRACV